MLSAIIGTLAALGLERMSGWIRNVFDALIYIAIMVPGIVIGISTLIAFVTVFDMVNPYLMSAWNIRIEMGVWTVIAAHVLFNIAVVALLVRARLPAWTAAWSRPRKIFTPRRSELSAKSCCRC